MHTEWSFCGLWIIYHWPNIWFYVLRADITSSWLLWILATFHGDKHKIHKHHECLTAAHIANEIQFQHAALRPAEIKHSASVTGTRLRLSKRPVSIEDCSDWTRARRYRVIGPWVAGVVTHSALSFPFRIRLHLPL